MRIVDGDSLGTERSIFLKGGSLAGGNFQAEKDGSVIGEWHCGFADFGRVLQPQKFIDDVLRLPALEIGGCFLHGS
jgi:hypothetical protein